MRAQTQAEVHSRTQQMGRPLLSAIVQPYVWVYRSILDAARILVRACAPRADSPLDRMCAMLGVPQPSKAAAVLKRMW